MNTEREKSRRVVRLRQLPVLPGESTPPRTVVRSRSRSAPPAGSGAPLLPLAPFWPSSPLLTRCASHLTASFFCRRCCARRVAAAPILPAEGEMACPLSFFVRVLVLFSSLCVAARQHACGLLTFLVVLCFIYGFTFLRCPSIMIRNIL